MVKARGGRFRPTAGLMARWLGALRHLPPSLSLLLLLLAAFPPAASADAPFVLQREVDFGGGAIMDFASAGPGSALVIGAMPDGFSVFSVDFVSGSITKFVSHTYLEGVVPGSIRADALSLEFSPERGLLLFMPRSGQAHPVLLDVSEAPKIKRYRLGFPQGYDVGGAAFCGDSVVFYPALVSLQEGRSRLLRLRAESGRLEELTPSRRFAIVRDVVLCTDDGRLLVLGFFTASAKRGGMELAYLSLEDGEVEIIPQTGDSLRASASGNHLALIRTNRTAVAPGDEEPAGYRLEGLVLDGLSLEPSGSVPIYSRPESMEILYGGRFVLLATRTPGGRRDLWLMDLLHGSKHRVLKGVLWFATETAGAAFIAQPDDRNALMYYVLAGAVD